MENQEHLHHTLDEGKQAQLAAVNANFPTKLNIRVVFEGAEYQADPESYQEMLAALVHAELPSGFYWVDSANNRVPITREQLARLAATVAAERFRLFDEHQRHKHKIRNATALAELFAEPATSWVEVTEPS